MTPSRRETVYFMPLFYDGADDTASLTDDTIFASLFRLFSSLCPDLGCVPHWAAEILVRRIEARLTLEDLPVFVRSAAVGHPFGNRVVGVLDEDELDLGVLAQIMQIVRDEVGGWVRKVRARQNQLNQAQANLVRQVRMNQAPLRTSPVDWSPTERSPVGDAGRRWW